MKKAVSLTVVVAVIAGFVGLMAWGMLNQEPATGRSGLTRVNKPAPALTLPLFDGGEFVLQEHLGKPVVINFWASWCIPCRLEAAGLERTWRAYRDQGVMFVGVDIQDADRDARAYLREFNITYPNGLDADGKITIDYGVVGIPVTYLVNREGIIARRFVGALSESRLATWIEELLAGTTPSGGVEEANPEGYTELDQKADQP